MNECIFCKIIKGELPSYKIYEDEHTLAFLDISCDAYGHTLVIPKNHAENIFDVKEEDLSHTMQVVQKVCNHYKKLGFTGVNLVNCSGKDAEQSVFHLHMHIIPRKTNDNTKIYPSLKKQDLNLAKIQEELKLF